MQILPRDLTVQIDSNNNMIQNTAEAGLNQWRNNQTAAKVEPCEADVRLRSEYRHVLRRAVESDFTALESLEQVRTELESGVLDEPAAIRTAARNITLFGI